MSATLTTGRRRCAAITQAGRRCSRRALASGTCVFHGGIDLPPEPKRPKPCRCQVPVIVRDLEDPRLGPRCLSCGRAPEAVGP